jgi:starch synthase
MVWIMICGQFLQISEKKKLISVITDSSIHNEHEPFSGQNDSSFSEGGHEAYIDVHEPQSEFDTPYEEFIDDQNEHYSSFEDEDTDFNGSSGDYLSDRFPRVAPSLYEPEAANGMNQDFAAQLSQVIEKEHSINVGATDNSSASGGVDILNIILVAAECAPWSKTGKNQNDKHIIMYLFFIEKLQFQI